MCSHTFLSLSASLLWCLLSLSPLSGLHVSGVPLGLCSYNLSVLHLEEPQPRVSVSRLRQEDGLPVLPGSDDHSGGNQGRTSCLFLVGPLLCQAPERSEGSAGSLGNANLALAWTGSLGENLVYSRGCSVTPRALLEPGREGGLVHSLYPHSQRPFGLACIELSCRFSQQGRWAAAESRTVLCVYRELSPAGPRGISVPLGCT